ncbi:hypothetical protein ACU686_03455 [Yinghuangia aomiensis]
MNPSAHRQSVRGRPGRPRRAYGTRIPSTWSLSVLAAWKATDAEVERSAALAAAAAGARSHSSAGPPSLVQSTLQ